MSLLIKGGAGVTKLSALEIDCTKDWLSYRIEGLGQPVEDTDAARKVETTAQVYLVDPTPNAERSGQVIRVRAGSGTKSYIKICVQNSLGDWEWVQIGVST